MLTVGGQYGTGGAGPSRHEPAPAKFIPRALALVLFVLLAVLVFVAFWTARGAAKRATCTSQLRQLANAFAMYKGQHGAYPPAYSDVWSQQAGRAEQATWEQLLRPYVGSEDVFCCPYDSRCAAARGGDASEGSADSHLHSYQYVRAEPVQPPASADSRAAGPRGTPPTDPSEAIRYGVLLVCWHHDTGNTETPRRALIAYEDGSVKWESVPDFLTPKRIPDRSPQPGRNDW